MKYLLDTHVFIWTTVSPEKLSNRVIDLILDSKNTLFLSSASIWEISIKRKIGKLEFLDEKISFEEFIIKSMECLDLNELPIFSKHIFYLDNLPLLHKDPFDRILISQAKSEGLILITDDNLIKKYKVKTLW